MTDTKNEIITLLQDAQGTDHIDESRGYISDAIIILENSKEFDQIKKIELSVVKQLQQISDQFGGLIRYEYHVADDDLTDIIFYSDIRAKIDEHIKKILGDKS